MHISRWAQQSSKAHKNECSVEKNALIKQQYYKMII